ncbi:MAG TPA: flagellin [Candidatus Sulfotelmatobacter sp.]|nr:flagellin [Candidatus Sulfotelmatobacter sp.]
MTRVSTFGSSQLLINQMLQDEQNIQTTQQQVSSGHVSNNYAGIADQAETLISSQTVAARTQQYINSNQLLDLKLQTYNTSLTSLASNAQSLTNAVTSALANNSATGLIDTVQNLLSQSIGQLNTQLDGQYIFGGSNTGTPPVNISTSAQLIAMTEPPTAAFSNDQQQAQAQINDTTTMTYGQVASTVGQPLLQEMQRILQYNNGSLGGPSPPGPGTAFSDPLTPAQISFLQGELSNLTNVTNGVNNAATQNGINQQELSNVEQQNTSQMTTVTNFISDIQDVDAASAITNLNQDQLALQTSYAVIGQLSQLSLVNWL